MSARGGRGPSPSGDDGIDRGGGARPADSAIIYGSTLSVAAAPRPPPSQGQRIPTEKSARSVSFVGGGGGGGGASRRVTLGGVARVVTRLPIAHRSPKKSMGKKMSRRAFEAPSPPKTEKRRVRNPIPASVRPSRWRHDPRRDKQERKEAHQNEIAAKSYYVK